MRTLNNGTRKKWMTMYTPPLRDDFRWDVIWKEIQEHNSLI